MKLTDGEKLIIVMMSQIMTKIGANDDIDPEFVAEAIRTGNNWALKSRYSGILHGDDVDVEVARQVSRILGMCGQLEWEIQKLTIEERGDLADFGEKVFVGFDANNEEHYGVALFMIESMGDFAEFKGRELNSHMPMVDRYNRMMVAKRHFDGTPLNLDAIKTILAA